MNHYIQAEAKQHLIFEQENVFDPIIVKWLDEAFQRCDLGFGHTATGTSSDHQQFFGKIYYWDGFQEGFTPKTIPPPVDFLSYYIMNEGLKIISPDTTFTRLHRLALNGQTPTNAPAIHIDEAEYDTSWTFLYYINESEGDTVIYNNFKDQQPFYHCKYQQNKIVAFPALYAHQALPPTEHAWRTTFAVTMHLQTVLQPQILDGRKRVGKFAN